jgi:hypothetical protein
MLFSEEGKFSAAELARANVRKSDAGRADRRFKG